MSTAVSQTISPTALSGQYIRVRDSEAKQKNNDSNQVCRFLSQCCFNFVRHVGRLHQAHSTNGISQAKGTAGSKGTEEITQELENKAS